MSLPPGFLDELRTRSSLAQVVGRKVTWDAKKTNQGKGDYWAPCPFHQEKTASFHLDDRKGYYYCFGCHAKGDALNFICETENVGFMEAVEILAREAGMPMPARDPLAQAKADQRTKLVDVMEAAVQYYRLQLNTAQGTAARDYLDNRGLTEATQAQFEIGFAPDSRKGLFQHLSGKGITPELIVEAGLAIKPDDGGAPFDRFRGRIMFPIRDIRKRAIAFGGRAMDPNARAKYLNSPETPLFDKGRSLYNHAPAREAAGKAQSLIVAEGYMDVIALAQAGFAHAVAPLGTAITEDQLLMIWRLTPEPIIALDGDKAGLRAAMRLIDIALPLLEPGRSLRFCLLPEGLDPDDLIKSQGKGAMQKLLDTAEPLVLMLWKREFNFQANDTPERKADLDKRLRNAIQKIGSPDVKRYYGEALKHFRWEEFKPDNWVPNFKKRVVKKLSSRPETRASLLARSTDTRVAEMIREMVILAVCLVDFDVIPQIEVSLERLELIEKSHQNLLLFILENYRVESRETFFAKAGQVLGTSAIESVLGNPHVRTMPAIVNPADTKLAIDTVTEQLAKLESERGLRKEIEDAQFDLTGLVDEGLTWRIQQATEAHNAAVRSTLPEGGTEDEDRENMSKYLQNLIDGQVWVKKKQ
jgi:DNA primase